MNLTVILLLGFSFFTTLSTASSSSVPLAQTPPETASSSATVQVAQKQSPNKISMDETSQDPKTALQTLLTQKFGTGAKVNVQQLASGYAQGMVSGGKAGQQWWLATQDTNEDWKIVATGSSYINCADVAGYHFPTSMVPSCWSYSKNTLVTF